MQKRPEFIFESTTFPPFFALTPIGQLTTPSWPVSKFMISGRAATERFNAKLPRATGVTPASRRLIFFYFQVFPSFSLLDQYHTMMTASRALVHLQRGTLRGTLRGKLRDSLRGTLKVSAWPRKTWMR